MNGLKLTGKAFAVFEDLRQIAEQSNGKSVAELLTAQRKARLEQAEAKQFGMTVEQFKGCLNGV